jgi:hypothetical protein
MGVRMKGRRAVSPETLLVGVDPNPEILVHHRKWHYYSNLPVFRELPRYANQKSE